MFKKGDKIRCIKKSDYYSYEFKLGDVCSVLRCEPGMKDMKVLTSNGHEIWNEVENFELVKEETMFETGERIRCTSSGSHPQWLKEGKIYVVCGHNSFGSPLVLREDGSRIDIAYGTFVKEVPMSKYQELKERIENLENGWDKEADDILRELKFFDKSLQCEKLKAFKQALFWLLDHSDIKDEKEEKIKELEMHRDTFATHIRSLNLQIEELRR